jgi:heme oxygenase
MSVPITSPPRSLHELLRDATRREHHALDTALSGLDLAHPADYRLFLTVHFRALGELRPRWRDCDVADFQALQACLSQDLELAVEAPGASEATAASALGVGYVIRGSRLGAKVLRARVPEIFPTAYLDCAMTCSWRHFLLELEQSVSDLSVAYERDMVEGARLAFATFADNFADLRAS